MTESLWVALYTDKHELNFDEVLRRMRYWTARASSEHGSVPLSRLRILQRMLIDHRNNLYFEPKGKP
jgi:hypothetical protein